MDNTQIEAKREEIDELLWSFRQDVCLNPTRSCKYQTVNSYGELACDNLDELLLCLKRALHEAGVEIVDREAELPETSWVSADTTLTSRWETADEYRGRLAGYVRTHPIIEEKHD